MTIRTIALPFIMLAIAGALMWVAVLALYRIMVPVWPEYEIRLVCYENNINAPASDGLVCKGRMSP